MSAVRNIALVLALLAPSAYAGDYAVGWSTVDGGGGASQAEPYAVNGTLGQPEAEPLQPASGGTYELVGGYWVVPSTPVVDALFADGFE